VSTNQKPQDAATKRNRWSFWLLESFRVGISLKGLNGLLETIGGILLLANAHRKLSGFVVVMLDQELSRNPHDFVAKHLLHVATQMTGDSRHFAGWYLISHGAVKVVLAIALLCNKLWAYPVTIAALGVFLCYEGYRFTLTHSPWLIVLAVFDLTVVVLTWLEYKEQIAARRAHSQSV
jgi:uncharacterized membrane protein